MIPLGLLSWRPGACLSGRSAAWLARLVRDQEAGGSNPLAPTNFPIQFSHWLDTDAQPKHKDRLMQHHRISCSEKLQRFSPSSLRLLSRFILPATEEICTARPGERTYD